jgi:hypothetical protein
MDSPLIKQKLLPSSPGTESSSHAFELYSPGMELYGMNSKTASRKFLITKGLGKPSPKQ